MQEYLLLNRGDVPPELTGYRDGKTNRQLYVLGPLNRINVFVGATNSGKSRCLRGLVRCQQYRILDGDQRARDLIDAFDACERLITSGGRVLLDVRGDLFNEETFAGSDAVKSLLHSLNREHRTGHAVVSPTVVSEVQKALGVRISGNEDRTLHQEINAGADWLRIGLQYMEETLIEADKEYLSKASEGETSLPPLEALKQAVEGIDRVIAAPVPAQETPPRRVYIPILRSAIPLWTTEGRLGRPVFVDTITRLYGIGQGQNEVVFTGEQLYDELERDKRSRLQIRQRLKDFEHFLGDAFFDRKQVELIPLVEQGTQNKPVVLHVDGQPAERELYNLGDGIHAIILLMYHLFMADPKSWVFIEEPELYLHPGLQRVFLDVLATHPVLLEKRLRVFFTTHSNHLLGMLLSEHSSSGSVFSFQRDQNNDIFAARPVYYRQIHPFTLLGVANSSVLLANCWFWVEGVTDRKYVRSYLRAYMDSPEGKEKRRYLEDVHYAFFEYAGSNLAHYLFDVDSDGAEEEGIKALFLSNRLFLLADRDEGREAKHHRLAEWNFEHFQYRVTDGLEIENLVSADLFRQILPDLIQGVTRDDVNRLAFTEADYSDKRLGAFFSNLLGDRCKAKLTAESGTLSTYYKNKLADLVYSHVNWDNMSEPARILARELYAFIERHNQ